MKLNIIKSRHRGFWTMGYWLAGKQFRDLRFSPWLTLFEARWLERNERD